MASRIGPCEHCRATTTHRIVVESRGRLITRCEAPAPCKRRAAALALALTTTTPTEQAGTAGTEIAMARKVTTAADIAAAIALGVMPESTPMVTPEQAAEQAEQAARQAVADALAVESARQARATAERATTTTTEQAETAEHRCTQRGCRHGAHTTGQPDRQVKMVAPCGAILRMTPRALGRAGGTITCGHGDPFAIDTTRRAYSRKTAGQA